LHVGGRRALAVQACADRCCAARRRKPPARAPRASPRCARRRRAAALSGAPVASAATDDLRAQRESLVREHMESENRHDFEATLATFAHPRYELIASGET